MSLTTSSFPQLKEQYEEVSHFSQQVWTWSQSIKILTLIDPQHRIPYCWFQGCCETVHYNCLTPIVASLPPVSLSQGPSQGFLSRQMVTSRTQMVTIINYVYSRRPLCASTVKFPVKFCVKKWTNRWLKDSQKVNKRSNIDKDTVAAKYCASKVAQREGSNLLTQIPCVAEQSTHL